MRKSFLRTFRKTVNASVDNVTKVLSFREWTAPFEWILDRDASAFDANNQRGFIVSPEIAQQLLIESIEVEELPGEEGHTMNIEWKRTQESPIDQIPLTVPIKIPNRSVITVRPHEVEQDMCEDLCKRISGSSEPRPLLKGLRGKNQVPWTSSSLVCSENQSAPRETIVKCNRAASPGGVLDAGVKRSLVESIEKYGFAVAEDASLSQVYPDGAAPKTVQCRFEAAEAIITDVFSILRNSHYGAMSTWSDGNSWKEVNTAASPPVEPTTSRFEGSEAHQDGAYQSTRLDLHTDCTYFVDCPKLQAFGCILTTPSTFGGESTLSDGAAAAMALQASHPSFFDILTRVPVGGRYQKEGRWYESHRPVISLTPCGSFIERITFNNSDRIPMGLGMSASQLREFYKAYFTFHELIHRQAIRFLLKPGQLLFFDNLRTLHGRLEFGGPRVMCGGM
ncbi:Hypothetical protein, putative [Bodo saltans]|uniref:TauD/TfdA-like domain-containing protein n=1 Tax=Bodo saltans TaxID=75058 RepID=A0A0S4IYD3_BODSA|nr:Hypothetical protein, putative [Bodo saltans]|eukprot:CUG16052.1 Hypothetical protein, putative [Bodo saltans]